MPAWDEEQPAPARKPEVSGGTPATSRPPGGVSWLSQSLDKIRRPDHLCRSGRWKKVEVAGIETVPHNPLTCRNAQTRLRANGCSGMNTREQG
jgi:hypothetical protein